MIFLWFRIVTIGRCLLSFLQLILFCCQQCFKHRHLFHSKKYMPPPLFLTSRPFFDPSDSYFLFADLVGFYTHLTYMHIFRRIFLSNYWWQWSDIWSQVSYRYPISWERKRFWTHQIPTSCLPTLLIFIHIEHTFCICPFLVTFFSATFDGRNLILYPHS